MQGVRHFDSHRDRAIARNRLIRNGVLGWCPRSESNRHAFKGGGFSSRFGFRRPDRQHRSGSWSGARLHHGLAALGARRLLSTPSRVFTWAWLGVSSDSKLSRAFTDFDGLHLVDFSARAQVVWSESAASTNSATRATRAYAVRCFWSTGAGIIEGHLSRGYGEAMENRSASPLPVEGTLRCLRFF
jgi:hypothetical protein